MVGIGHQIRAVHASTNCVRDRHAVCRLESDFIEGGNRNVTEGEHVLVECIITQMGKTEGGWYKYERNVVNANSPFGNDAESGWFSNTGE